MPDDEGYEAFLAKSAPTIRDMNIDAFADGVIAHRDGKAFHDNPHAATFYTLVRLSWAFGWNERALHHG